MFHVLNNKSILSIFIIIFTLNFSAYGKSSPIGKFILVKGDVSVLQPHTKEALKAKRGTSVFKDSSVFVNGKGVARIRLINKSSLTLGPNSKIIVDMEKSKKASLINLLSGQIRAKVTKNQVDKKKFLVKTRSAIMGVRGTEFQVTFNPVAKRSSLLTFDGQVDFKKAPPKAINKNIVKDEISNLDTFLEDKPKKVTKGEFTNVVLENKEAMAPVQINATQFVLLEQNKDFKEIDKPLTKDAKEKLKADIIKTQNEFKKLKNGKENNQGFVDAKTGIYIPPIAKGKKKKLLGTISSSGKYIVPKGVELDSKKGLVLTKNADDKTKALISKVNKSIDAQAPKAKKYDQRYDRYFKK